ncbi:PEPxxWA-CTERM sorting domain-containing protein [Sphingomonas sp. XMGL2]|uniref:PEPxxWA-CTERM sorting domain-containing protein n=2 Tax=Sphingomonas quercus TaxID=2842451 RepID=A0ABS6BN88_9SPHN|nr:PEPxxWA-CTERM sorting domain-containing protein [Sphingomonas quercus]
MTMFSTVFDFANVETESFALSFNNAVLAAGGSPFGASAIGDSTMSGVGNFDSQPLPPPFVPTVPEPATWAMMALGIGLVGFATRRHRRLAVTS